jgi:hypothetical protein
MIKTKVFKEDIDKKKHARKTVESARPHNFKREIIYDQNSSTTPNKNFLLNEKEVIFEIEDILEDESLQRIQADLDEASLQIKEDPKVNETIPHALKESIFTSGFSLKTNKRHSKINISSAQDLKLKQHRYSIQETIKP